MWYTENHNYYYLIGIKTNSTKESESESEQTLKTIIKTEYAVYTVPNDMTIIDAWTDFFSNQLPQNGYKQNYEIGLFFEHHPNGFDNECELWTPIMKKSGI